MLSLTWPLFLLALFLLITWGLWREYRRVQTLEGFTDAQKAVLTRQVIALILFLPFLAFQMGLFIIGPRFARDSLTNPCLSQFNVVIGAVILSCIAISSIRHQVTILRGRGQRKLLKGRSAVVMGVFVLVISIGITMVLLVTLFLD